MKESDYISIAPYVDIIYRHRVSALCVLIVGLILTAVFVGVYPEHYRSTAVLIARSPEVYGKYLENPGGQRMQSELHLLTDLALSRDQLSNIIEHYNLYPEARRQKVSMADIVQDMRERIVLQHVSMRGRRAGSGKAFSISFSYTDPALAQQVTSKLADTFINDDLQLRLRDATATTQFINGQLAQISSKLTRKGREIKDLEGKFNGSLPSDLQTNEQNVGNLEIQLGHNSDLISELEQRQIQIGQELVQLPQDKLTITTPSGTQASGSPQALLNELESKLVRMRSHYKDSYPDVVALKAEIAALKKEVKDRQEHPQKYESPEERELEAERAAISLKLANRRHENAVITGEIDQLNQRIAETPAHAQALASVQRNYDVLASTYHGLLAKELTAKMSEHLEQAQEGERLDILDPATLPSHPLQPDRLSIGVGGALLSLLLALAIPFGLFFTDVSFRDPEEIRDEHGLPVAATIPLVTAIDSRASAKKIALKALGVSSACVLVGVGAIWFVALRGHL